LGANFNTEFGAVIEVAEETEKSPYAAFALLAEVQYLFPARTAAMLLVAGHFSSGAWNDLVGVFNPITYNALGKILRPVLPGIAFLDLGYIRKLPGGLSMELLGGYYFRTDKTTFFDPDMDSGSNSSLLGGEVYGGLKWMAVSDVFLSAGGGFFFPGTGKVFKDDAPLKYRIELTANISF
jgi:hypothetical protein